MSRLAAKADVLLWFPSFSTVSNELFDAALAAAACLFNADAWGCHLLMGSTYAVAHLLTVQSQGTTGGSAGPVTSKSMGPVSMSFGVAQQDGSDAFWASTGPGRMYLALRDQLGPMVASEWTLPVVGGGCGCQ
jgi:hypothetical protein